MARPDHSVSCTRKVRHQPPDTKTTVSIGFPGNQHIWMACSCSVPQTHKDGKWCWLPSEIEELRRQSVDGPMLTTWNKISKVSSAYPYFEAQR